MKNLDDPHYVENMIRFGQAIKRKPVKMTGYLRHQIRSIPETSSRYKPTSQTQKFEFDKIRSSLVHLEPLNIGDDERSTPFDFEKTRAKKL